MAIPGSQFAWAQTACYDAIGQAIDGGLAIDIAEKVMSDSGVYIVVYSLEKQQEIAVGRLGQFQFAPGIYFYVGSAQKNLAARLERHARKEKPLRWHIDCLSTAADMIGAMTIVGPRERECELAGELRGLYEAPVPGFGASDCCCGGHLFYTPAL